MDGLRMTRDYRAFTYWFRTVSRFISKYTFDPLESLGVSMGLIKTHQKTLVWTKKHTYNPKPKRAPSNGIANHAASPSIELTVYPDHDRMDIAIQDTPAMAHSLFPPAITPRRTRYESDASFTEPSLPIYEQYRNNHEGDGSSIQCPSEVHRSRAASRDNDYRTSDDRRHSSEVSEQRSSDELLLSPTSLSNERPIFSEWTGLDTAMQSRRGYQRANSDPGSPPDLVVVRDEQGGLGISVQDDEERRSR
jgi:hypothetical protein